MISESKIEYPYRSAMCTARSWVSTVSGRGSGQKTRSMSRARRTSSQLLSSLRSFVACALAQKACRDGYCAFYTRAAALFRDLAIARADGSLRSLLARLSRIDVLLIDDWALAPMAETERRDFWEICEDRYQTRSTILTSQ